MLAHTKCNILVILLSIFFQKASVYSLLRNLDMLFFCFQQGLVSLAKSRDIGKCCNPSIVKQDINIYSIPKYPVNQVFRFLFQKASMSSLLRNPYMIFSNFNQV